jgi:hypothetical protein
MADEIAVVAQAALDQNVRQVVASIAGTSPAQETLGLLGDVIRGRRARTQIKVLEKTTSAIEKAGFEVRVVPDKTLVPLLEYAGLEDFSNEDMVGRWRTSSRMPLLIPGRRFLRRIRRSFVSLSRSRLGF